MVSTRRSPESPARLADIGVLSAIGIVLVVFGHSHPVFDPSQLDHRFFKATLEVIYAFHMPLFFYISGNLLCFSLEQRDSGVSELLDWGTARSLIRKRFARLVVPYLCISTAVFPIKSTLAGYAHHVNEFSVTGYVYGMLVPWQNPIGFFWFLPTLFLASSVIILTLMRIRLAGAGPLIVFAVFLLCGAFAPIGSNPSWLNLGGVAYFLIYVWLGILHRLYRRRVDPWIERLRSTPHIIVFVTLLIWGSLTIRVFRPLHILFAVLGILVCVLIARMYVERGLSFLGSLEIHSYRIYLLSWFPQTLFRVALAAWAGAGVWTTSLAMLASGLLLPIVASIAINRFLPRLDVVIPR